MSKQVSQVWIFSITWFLPEEVKDHEQAKSICESKTGVFEKYAKKWIFNGEIGKVTNRMHIQGYMNLKEKSRAKTLAKKLSEELPGVVVKRSSNRGKEALKNYCMKEETRFCGPWADHPVYRGQDLTHTLKGWQQQVVNFVTAECKDDRHINVIWDPIGGVGKSYLVKYLCYYHKIAMFPYMKTNDVMNRVIEGGPKKAYLFDLTRSRPMDVANGELYANLEMIKNGNIVSGKFKGGEMMMLPPHVWVMMNHEPKLEALSKDRWIIWTIIDDVLVKI